MNFLPTELLFEIFDYLSTSDLKSLSLTTKCFNNLINNTKLADKFTLKFDSKCNTREWIGSRKYSALQIENEIGIFSILRCIGDDIKKIYISVKSIDLKTIVRILNLCPQLTFLKFFDVKTHSVLELIDKRELPRHKNFELWIENATPNLLDIFTRVEIIKLTILAPTSMSDFGICWQSPAEDCRIAFRNILKSQTKLEHLMLENFTIDSSLFHDGSLDVVPFRLKSLKLRKFSANNVNFYQFLRNHVDSMETVDFESESLTEEFAVFLSNCHRLKDVHYVGCLKHFRPIPSVERLTAKILKHEPSRIEITEIFPNLIELNIYTNNISIFDKLEYFVKLRKLEITGTYLKRLNIPSLKYLTLRSCLIDSNNLLTQNTLPEELTIDKMPLMWMNNYLLYDKINLKLLTLKNSFIYRDLEKSIEKSDKIKCCKIINPIAKL